MLMPLLIVFQFAGVTIGSFFLAVLVSLYTIAVFLTGYFKLSSVLNQFVKDAPVSHTGVGKNKYSGMIKRIRVCAIQIVILCTISLVSAVIYAGVHNGKRNWRDLPPWFSLQMACFFLQWISYCLILPVQFFYLRDKLKTVRKNEHESHQSTTIRRGMINT